MIKLPRCADCKFWDNRGDETRNGDCRKHAPIGVKTPGARRGHEVLDWRVTAMWPMTNPADFCGEFERRS